MTLEWLSNASSTSICGRDCRRAAFVVDGVMGERGVRSTGSVDA